MSSSSNTPATDAMNAMMNTMEDADMEVRHEDQEEQPQNGDESPQTATDEASRRAEIRRIMSDHSLSALEKRRQVQSLMDGRRRSSGSQKSVEGMSRMAQAAAAAAEFYQDESSSVSSDDSMQDDDNSGEGVGEYRPPSRGGSVSSNRSYSTFQRLGRSASLKNFAAGAAAAAAAASAALAASNDPQDKLNHARRMEKSRPACDHYERNCTIISPCCGLAFGCRICHDECPVLPPPRSDPSHWAQDMDVQKEHHAGPQLKRRRSLPTNFDEFDALEETTHHQIDRFAIARVICRQCFTVQSSKTDNCIQCGISFGEYHCNICNLWMSKADRPYHCEDCGFCRVGGRENFQHCNDCGMCIDAHVFDDHNCKAGKYMSDCPVCQEDLFSSRSASHEMACGHAIHWECYQELVTYDSRCPVCKKTAEAPEHMMSTWSAMAMGIALQPVPPEMARVVNIICNDCEEKSTDRRWHFLGVQCMKCSSFNTTVERTTHVGREAAAYLGDIAANSIGQAARPPASLSMDDMEAMQESASSFTDNEHLTAAQQRNLHEHLMSMAGARQPPPPPQQQQVQQQQQPTRMGDGNASDLSEDESL